MMRYIKLSLACVIAIVFTSVSCKKNEGPAGKDGSANVTSTNYTINGWTDNSSYWYTTLNVPELTSDNIDKAAVQVYWGTQSGTWYSLPYTYVASTNYFFNYITTVSKVEVRWVYNGIGSGSSPNSVFGAVVKIKVVVIPPQAREAKPNVDLDNYQEVKVAYDIKG